MSNVIRDMVVGLTMEEMQEIMADYSQFEKDCVIGDCLLRRTAESLPFGGEQYRHIIMWMNQIANEVFRNLAYRYLVVYNNND